MCFTPASLDDLREEFERQRSRLDMISSNLARGDQPNSSIMKVNIFFYSSKHFFYAYIYLSPYLYS